MPPARRLNEYRAKALSSSREPAKDPAAADSIETVLKLEKEDEQELAPVHRAFHAIGAFFGTIYFILFQVLVVTGWIALNSVPALRAWAIDPFPFPLLATFLSLEAVLLTSCVLIRQNAMDRTSERRDYLELQINLLAEKEATRTLDLLHRVAQHLRMPDAGDHQMTELAKETRVDQIARDLKNRENEAETK
ncbi:DUF1003 domain-containing protein [Bradyrhizobium liaoningense]|uniref:DUF1003 domain-containing protein n=1 Tax=Bradyrhizobium liaoningense TaxID=43992 RepID=UPI001BA6B4AB|nr:DUF1003 domain-containing protein [Bradyrhizobium liaoningense]MBR0823857.1 DUF1003 domain-containing protein [Bradyrhizobium liaoningense]